MSRALVREAILANGEIHDLRCSLGAVLGLFEKVAEAHVSLITKVHALYDDLQDESESSDGEINLDLLTEAIVSAVRLREEHEIRLEVAEELVLETARARRINRKGHQQRSASLRNAARQCVQAYKGDLDALAAQLRALREEDADFTAPLRVIEGGRA